MKIQGADPSGLTQFRKSPQYERIDRQEQKKVGAVVIDETGNQSQFSRQQLEQALDKLNKTMETYNTQLRFEIHRESQEMQVSIINCQTEEVIRKIPPDKVLDIVAHVKRMLGLIVDEFI